MGPFEADRDDIVRMAQAYEDLIRGAFWNGFFAGGLTTFVGIILFFIVTAH